MVMIGVGNEEEDNDRHRDGFKGHHRRILTATTEGEGREYEGPMDRERMATTTNEWTREKEQKKNTSFVPPPPKKMRADIEERDDANNDDGEEEGEVKEEGERKEKFVPPPGEMTMKSGAVRAAFETKSGQDVDETVG